jgi:hypothetical protein
MDGSTCRRQQDLLVRQQLQLRLGTAALLLLLRACTVIVSLLPRGCHTRAAAKAVVVVLAVQNSRMTAATTMARRCRRCVAVVVVGQRIVCVCVVPILSTDACVRARAFGCAYLSPQQQQRQRQSTRHKRALRVILAPCERNPLDHLLLTAPNSTCCMPTPTL